MIIRCLDYFFEVEADRFKLQTTTVVPFKICEFHRKRLHYSHLELCEIRLRLHPGYHSKISQITG
jgi:hypothetical protein